MNLELVHIFSNLLGLFLLIAVGYGAVQLGVISKDSSGSLSRLLLKITLPCTIFTSLLRPYDPAFFKEVIIILALGILLFPLNTLISPLLARLFQVPKSRRGVWNFCASFCNTGFMGFPIVLALFGEKGLSMAVVFNITFNLLVYSLGAKMICSDSPPDDNGSVKFRWRSVLFTAINGSTLLGLIFYFAQLSVPAAVLTPPDSSVQCHHPAVHDRHWDQPVQRPAERPTAQQRRDDRLLCAAYHLPPGFLSGLDGGPLPAPAPGVTHAGRDFCDPGHAYPCCRYYPGGKLWGRPGIFRTGRIFLQLVLHRHDPVDDTADRLSRLFQCFGQN